jgi:hypothetical protein
MTLKNFAIVVEGDVAGTITLDDTWESENVPRLIAALESNPQIIPAPVEAQFGWTWDGTNFIQPEA